MLEFVVLLVTISSAIANPIAIAYSDSEWTDFSNTDIPDDLGSNFLQTAVNTPHDCVQQDSSRAVQDSAQAAIDNVPSNDIFKRGRACTTNNPAAVSPLRSKLEILMSEYKAQSMIPFFTIGKSDFQPAFIDDSFEPRIKDPDDGCQGHPNLRYRLTCQGPEVAHPTMAETSADFVINCIRGEAHQALERFWYPASHIFASYCCAFWKNSVSLPRPVAENST